MKNASISKYLLVCIGVLLLSGCSKNPVTTVPETLATDIPYVTEPFDTSEKTTEASIDAPYVTEPFDTSEKTTETSIDSYWEMGYFVDEFGDKTNKAYVNGVFVGDYDDSVSRKATAGLKITFTQTNRLVMFELFKGMSQVKLLSSEQASLKVKTEAGVVKELELLCTDDGVFFGLDNELFDLLMNNNPLSWAITISGQYSSTDDVFRFKTYNYGLEELLEVLYTLPKEIEVGSIVTLGSYEQDNNIANGTEPIEWIVLAKKGENALLISNLALDIQQYNATDSAVTWETCSLRTWLNETFYNTAFSSEEKTKIITATVTADKNPSFDTSAGNNTKDKVFILSINEANKYFASDDDRKCYPSAYAKEKIDIPEAASPCFWWLRSPGHLPNYAANVTGTGLINDLGNFVFFDASLNAVRPALWINIGS